MSTIDLHMHACYSDDGELLPEVVADLCLDASLNYFSITDHNSIKALIATQNYIQNKPIHLIPGIELDISFDNELIQELSQGGIVTGQIIAEAALAYDTLQSNPLLKPYHPGNNIKEDLSLLNSIISTGVQGLEVFSSYHSPEQVAFYKTFAKTYHLFMTCGSDFHGKTKPNIKLGSVQLISEDQQSVQSFIDYILGKS